MTPSLNSLPVAVTMGDPAGIGPEIIAKLALDPTRPPTDLLVVGDEGSMRRAFDALTATPPSSLRVIQAGDPLPSDLHIGRVDARAGAAAYSYVQKAIDLALAGKVRAIVTAPLAKAAMALAGIAHPGHTEILADRCGVEDFAMMLANDELRVILISIHLSLAGAVSAVSQERELRTIRLAHEACRDLRIAKPRIAVAGLNPHAGEGGLFGREEIDAIAPAIAVARAEGLDVSGPWPGDTIFMRARQGEFDIVVAQYHDQGLIPVKYLGVDKGVNVTIGLPFVRTSVDHGVAFDIAGQGVADPSSLKAALALALAMTGG